MGPYEPPPAPILVPEVPGGTTRDLARVAAAGFALLTLLLARKPSFASMIACAPALKVVAFGCAPGAAGPPCL